MKILWLSGWATDLRLYLPELAAAQPDAEHRALSWTDLFSSEGERLLSEELRRADVVIAWSQGAQLLLRSESALSLLGFSAGFAVEASSGAIAPRLILVAPALRFCRPETGWPVAVVRGMARAIEREAEPVLRRFAEQMGGAGEEQERWVAQAVGIDPAVLASGLRLLCEPTPFPEPLRSPSEQFRLLQGGDDRIIPPDHTEALFREELRSPEQFSPPLFRVLPGGSHRVFDPVLLRAIGEVLREKN